MQCWRPSSPSQQGLSGPTQWVSHRAAITPARLRTSWWLEIVSTSRRSGGGETSSNVTWKGRDLLVNE